jgi:CheY-like chemotaxis protein
MLKDKASVLVVDDDPALVTLTRHKLIQKGYEVLTAQNGNDALAIVKSEYPDLIISDVEMPGLDGLELCRTIKADPKLTTIPFMLVTSYANTENILHGIEAGADNYITKPYDDETLFMKVKELLTNPPVPLANSETQEILVEGNTYTIRNEPAHLINLLISAYKNALAQNIRMEKTHAEMNAINLELELTKKEHEELLQNIFPEKVAKSLLAYGNVQPERYEDVSILFTDFDGFTTVVPKITPEKLIESLSFYFDNFDIISSDNKMLKIKTIGDSYMAAGGIPERNVTHPIDTVLTALQMLQFVRFQHERSNPKVPYWPIRIGIHTGEAVVGVIGKQRFAYDIWGNAVNIASRMEEYGQTGEINISQATYERVKNFFDCELRGEVEVKNMGKMPMYFVRRIKEEFSEDEEGFTPNKLFIREYNVITRVQGSD